MQSFAEVTRRAFLGGTALVGAMLPFARRAGARASVEGGGFVYEVQRTEEEWRTRLSKYEYEVMRRGGTEWAKTSELWDDYREGDFYCKGCDLHLYNSEWRERIDKGWVFFAHSMTNAVLTAVDRRANYTDNPDAEQVLIEVHCRRCGSHLGHVLNVESKLVHCINGIALRLDPAST